MIHVIAAKSALFFATGLVRRLAGSTELKRLGGLYRRQPLVAAADERATDILILLLIRPQP
jgi:multicomponent Na+:H+ antiporter subunit D